jgi:hypothetical protein
MLGQWSAVNSQSLLSGEIYLISMKREMVLALLMIT